MISITNENKKQCCGCSACEQICPASSIIMQEDEEGFLYPVVDSEKCVGCDKCEAVCPVIRKSDYSQCGDKTLRAIGGWHKDDNVREKSSSGGAFTLFAQKVLSEGGTVYGCRLNESIEAVHVRVDRIDELDSLRGSKYVQSRMENCYSDIYADIKSGLKVLFTGTPCQCAGLHSYLNIKCRSKELQENRTNNLYVCDFICHGVPSPKVFKSYLRQLENKHGRKIIDYRFRLKDKGWNQSGLQLGTLIKYDNSELQRNYPAYNDSYMCGFLDDIYLRPSCYECQFKELPKYYSDITFADFWGVNKIAPELNDSKGTSLIVLFSKKGEELFNSTSDDFEYKECDYKKAILYNPPLIKSADYSVRRKKFFIDYFSNDFSLVEKRHMNKWLWGIHKAQHIGWNTIEKIIKMVLGKMFQGFHKELTEVQWNSFFQFVKFCMVGVSNSLVSYIINITTLLILKPLKFEFDYVVANCMAFILSVTWSYCWNNRYVFVERLGEHRSIINTIVRTYATYAFSGILLNNVLGTIWIEVWEISRFIAPLLNLPVTVPVNFLISKFWTYNSRKDN